MVKAQNIVFYRFIQKNILIMLLHVDKHDLEMLNIVTFKIIIFPSTVFYVIHILKAIKKTTAFLALSRRYQVINSIILIHCWATVCKDDMQCITI